MQRDDPRVKSPAWTQQSGLLAIVLFSPLLAVFTEKIINVLLPLSVASSFTGKVRREAKSVQLS